MAKLRIGVLYEFWWDEDEERGPDARPKRQAPDVDVQAVYDTLKKIGHNPVFLRLDGSRASLGELADSETDLIFNMAESYGGDDTLDYNIAAYLELLGRRFTGTGRAGSTSRRTRRSRRSCSRSTAFIRRTSRPSTGDARSIRTTSSSR
jgi:D-alanine-D-alanine ligase